MKAFDLNAAKRGAAVCTRSGGNVRIICFDRICRTFPIIALRINSDDEEYTASFTIDGRRFSTSETDGDLMMRDDDYLEKLERGEYHIEDKLEMVDSTVKENLTVENPTCKESLPVDREYWRRVYAGQIAGGLASHNGINIIGSEIIIAKASCNIADALIEELEKTKSDCSKGSHLSGRETKPNLRILFKK